MIEDDPHDEDATPPGIIGVGMGGSCPTCRAPVDLGQEFCLECGSPIRFTPRPRARRGSGARPGAPTPPPPRRSGFPWVPFLIVLALVGGGIALSLVNGSDAGKKSPRGTSTEQALPTITNEAPPTTTSTTSTTTLEDCDPTRPLNGTQPAVQDASPTPDGGQQDEDIPSLDEGLVNPGNAGLNDGFSDDVPSIEPTDTAETTGATVTVDQNENICPTTDATDPVDPVDPIVNTTTTPGSTTPATTTPTTPTTPKPNPSTTASGDWPTGRASGWTVIVAGYPGNEARAQQRAADVQEDGFDDSGVLLSTSFPSLCPGFYVVFSGVFDNRAKAETRRSQLAALPDYAGLYVREVRSSGTPPSSCTKAN